jgi:hypothetical protein
MVAMRSDSLTRSSDAPRTGGGAARAGRGDEQRRELVDHVRHVFERHVDAAQRGMRHVQVRDRFAALLACLAHVDVGAHRAQHAQQAGAPRVHAHAPQHQVRARHDARSHEEERRR